jgi:hypothetical protein
MDLSEPRNPARHELIAPGVFAILLVFHIWGVMAGWQSRSLPGNEFRQAQTAISALFIQRENNFSLAYPTPVLGAPWSVPFEFPLYQWSVVLVSNVTGVPLIQSGRAVSVICFYLCLPALWLLLRRIGVPIFGRWLILGLTLTCPLYIFYTRAVLIETMALMFSLWFLYALVVAVERRSVGWLVVANLAGALAGMVKVTTFLAYLLPAGAWVVFLLWTAGRSGGADRALTLRRILGWVTAALALPFLATYGWLRYADAVKARNPLAVDLISGNLQAFNFGTWLDRTTWAHWEGRFHLIQTELAPPLFLAGIVVVFLVCGRRWWKWIAGGLLAFFSIQLIFPILYEIHAYYFVANGFFLLFAAGLVLTALFESSIPRWAAWAIVATLHLVQIVTYVRQHYEEQRYWTPGGTGLADALRKITEPEDVILIVGDDWNSTTPFFAERRAIMLRTGWENSANALDQVLINLRDRPVSAVVLREPANSDVHLRSLILNRFEGDFAPAFTWRDATVYLGTRLRNPALAMLTAHLPDEVKIAATGAVETVSATRRNIEVDQLSPLERRAFGDMSPSPVRVFATFGVGAEGEPGSLYYNAHPDSRLWFKPEAGKRQIEASYRIVDAAWKEASPSDATDGVMFRIVEQRRDGVNRPLFEKLLNPRDQPEDRGVQRVQLTIDFEVGSELLFETTPGPARNFSRDWAGWGKIQIR